MTTGINVAKLFAEQGETERSERWMRWGNLALNVGAVAGVVCMLLAAASMFFGISPLVFRSGSMAPEITTGSLALARTISASEVQVGDVIAVKNDSGTSITHRVVSVTEFNDDNRAVAVTLKGDANPVDDPFPYVITEAERVFVHVQYLGYLVMWLSGRTAIFLGGLLSGALLMLAFGPARAGGEKMMDEEIGND